MAKEPTTHTKFRIFADVSAENMGPLLAALTNMGLENIGYELVTDVVTYNKRNNGIKHENTAEEALQGYSIENPTFLIADAIKHFITLGRTKAAIYTAAAVLVKNGFLKKLGPGSYSVATIKAIEPPKEPKSTKAKAKDKTKQQKAAPEKRTRSGGSVPKYPVPNKVLIAKAIGQKKKFSMDDLKVCFESEHRNLKSISPILTNMIKARQIKVIGKGLYEVTSKISFKKKKDRPDNVVDSAMNGPVEAAGETTNG